MFLLRGGLGSVLFELPWLGISLARVISVFPRIFACFQAVVGLSGFDNWRLALTETKRILFVCLGNIVRSPLAENLFLHLAANAGFGDRYTADSAGTGGWHAGEQPDARMRQVALQHGFRYSGRARQFVRQDFDRFDLIIAMDRENRADLLDLSRNEEDRSKIYLLREFDPQAGPNPEVPDPYYGGLDGFEMVYQIIERSCQGLLKTLEEANI